MANINFRYSGAGDVILVKGGGTGTNFKKGDFVSLSNGTVVIGSSGLCSGIALNDDASGADIQIELLDPNGLYVVTFNGTTATNLIGDAMSITWTTTSQVASAYDSSNNDVYCVGLYDPAGTSGGRIIVRFHYRYFTGRTS